ncbi:Protein fmp32, mitochondrial [Elasticomyces elasticus]|nr:Protein fmp32, mitochondrial [Elasticomyces elasticus]
MATPIANSSARTISRLAWTASTARPSFTATHLPTAQHERRISATTAHTQAQWARRRQPSILAAAQKSFSTSQIHSRDHHFDTLKFVSRLKSEGFTEPQAVALMKVLGNIIEESIQNLTRTMVLREDQEKATYTQKVDFAKLRSELLSADTTESSLTRASHEKLTNDLAKLSNRLRDEVQRTQASVRLDLNLEKGRIREEANSQDLKIKETETRIEQESAGLRERLEAVKFSTLQWLMGVCTGTAAIMLGVWRLLM